MTPLVVVPRKLRRMTRFAAAALVLVMAGVSIGIGTGPDADFVPVSDQLGLFGLGLVMAAAALLVGRPRVEADERSLRVRNVLGSYDVDWDLVVGIRFADGAPWATIDLADDEEIALMAVAASDGPSATQALLALRALHEAHRGTE